MTATRYYASCVLCTAAAVGAGVDPEAARDVLRALGWVVDRDDVCPRCALVAFPDPWGRYVVGKPADHPASASRGRSLSVPGLITGRGSRRGGGAVAATDAGPPLASSAGPAGVEGVPL